MEIRSMLIGFVWETGHKSTLTNVGLRNFEVRVKVSAVGK
jgi:hypothetical protein